MISYSNKLRKTEQLQSEPSLVSTPKNRTNFRCFQNLKDALERSEELLHKAEELQKEFGKKSMRS
ncbi:MULTISPECIES: hypothetical protein [unclassified Neptuniibacter]|jgi:hypothetical protein|uniref:hypothetical protein n=1 Tax=unclassified Neptuniibacter TaxID=2630693 RepID=UPI0026E18F89|nr:MULTISPECIES: hypothetical protein [unclassified Neptuniibacter]MDO6514956.1 hypothetical protein [Neptuniibacter sp. 2_MG-2023]MDO6594285.1 hypothetical protein [Neptuniibacter sp. 1_MG-2023]